MLTLPPKDLETKGKQKKYIFDPKNNYNDS